MTEIVDFETYARRLVDAGLSDGLSLQGALQIYDSTKAFVGREAFAPPVVSQKLVSFLERGNIIAAIREYRIDNAVGLREAKAAVENIVDDNEDYQRAWERARGGGSWDKRSWTTTSRG